MTAAEIASTERFGARVDAYVRARPGYPDAAAAMLGEVYGLGPQARVADIGAGTGLSSLPFLRAGWQVTGVEPNAPMREASRIWSAQFAGHRSIDGSAEHTGLPAASIDLAIAGQAFHWFDPAAFRREVLRILKPEGALALLWNSRVHEASAFMQGYNELLLAHCPEYRAKWKGDDVGSKYADAMRVVFGTADYRLDAFANQQSLDREGLIARLDSDSYAPPPGTPAHHAMIDDARRLFDAHAEDGLVHLIYRTRVFHARPARSA